MEEYDPALDAQDEEMYLSLIDDLDEPDKEILVKKLAAYFAAGKYFLIILFLLFLSCVSGGESKYVNFLLK